jgi:hypothetical protein
VLATSDILLLWHPCVMHHAVVAVLMQPLLTENYLLGHIPEKTA